MSPAQRHTQLQLLYPAFYRRHRPQVNLDVSWTIPFHTQYPSMPITINGRKFPLGRHRLRFEDYIAWQHRLDRRPPIPRPSLAFITCRRRNANRENLVQRAFAQEGYAPFRSPAVYLTLTSILGL